MRLAAYPQAVLAATIVLAGCLAGCQSILGLDETHVGALVDAGDLDARSDTLPEIDAPPACAAPIACTPVAGRALCGQIYGSGDHPGPLRVETPTGQACDVGSTAGPCALTLKVGTAADFATYGTTPATFDTNSVAGTVDDCGRFSFLDLPATDADLMIVATGSSDTRSTANLVTRRKAEDGADLDARVLNVTVATSTAWAGQLSATGPAELPPGILFTFLRNTMPKTDVRVAIDQKSPPTAPFFDPGPTGWAAYFAGAVPFGAMDPTNVDNLVTDPPVPASGTEASGTAYGAFGAVGMHADGLQPGRRCTVPLHLTTAPTMFVVVTVDGC